MCLKVPDGEGDYLLLSECQPSFAEPYPGDEGRFLVHATVTLEELVAQACDPSVIRELARALEREADRMELAETDYDEEYGIWWRWFWSKFSTAVPSRIDEFMSVSNAGIHQFGIGELGLEASTEVLPTNIDTLPSGQAVGWARIELRGLRVKKCTL